MDQSDIGAQVRASTQVAQQTAAQPEGCKVCKRSGLPILPLRYAVVPKGKRKGSGPELHTTLGSGVKDVKLPGDTHEYALRALREGYVYVLLDKKIWQGYEVTSQGHLRQFDPFIFPKAPPEALVKRCRDEGHDIPGSFLNIDPNQYKSAWIAFSQDAWTATVLNEYKSGKRPSERFTKVNIKTLLEKPDTVQHAFEIDGALNRLSKGVEEFAKDAKDFGSVHGFHPRCENTKNLSEYFAIQKRKHPKSKPSAVVLLDADGVLQELNHARLKVINDIDNWSKHPERARKHQTSEAIKALNKLALVQSRQAVVKDTRYKPLTKTMSRQDYQWMRDSGQIPNGATFTPGKDKNGLPDFNSGTVTVTQEMIDAYVDKQGARRAKPIIERYKDRYKEADREAFETLYQRTLTTYNEDLKKRDTDYSAWLSASAWEITAHDYQNNHTRSGAAFANKIGLALAGGGITEKSLAWWEKTLALEPTNPKNPVYAAIFGKQEKILTYLVPEKLPGSGKEMEEADARKGGALYDTVKTLATTEISPDGKSALEWSAKKVTQLGQEGITQTQLALAGAIAALDKNGKLTALMEQTSMRAYQASSKLYHKRDIALVTIRLTVEEYRHWLYEEVWGDTKKTFNQTSRAAKRKVRSVLERGILAIPDMQTRKTVINVMVWTVLSAQEINSTLAAYRRGTVNNIDKIMRSVQAHAATLSQPITQAIGKLEGLSAKDMSNIMRALGAGARNVHEPLFAGGAMYFQYWSLKQSMKDMQTKIGKDKQDALFGVVASSIGLLGSTVELSGAGIKTAGKVMGRLSIVETGMLVMRWGGAIAAATAVVDAGQCVLAGVRAFKSKDSTSMVLYGFAAVALIGGAYAGVNAALASAALLGPVGIALALIILGIGLMYLARQAESTATENWLKRTAFGIADANEKFPDPATEMTELNAVIIGLGIEMDFNDDWNQVFKGEDTFNFRVKLPQFDPKLSAYEIVLDLQTDEKAAPIRYYQGHSLKTASSSGLALPAPKDIDGMMQISIDIPVNNAIKIAKARAVYWIDRMNPAMEMATSLSVTD